MGFTVNLLISMVIKVLFGRTQGAARFTVVPPSVLYVSVEETAKLVWDYSVDNRAEEFNLHSPGWLFYDDNDLDFLIAQENVFNKGKWSINSDTCPARLLNPVRVSKESTATLVIHNVTLADSGTYGCVLYLATRSPITSKVKLVVTSFPYITINPSSSNIPINESQALSISCSAVGTPLPNITWLRLLDGIKSHKKEGVGNVTFNIQDITRNDSGIYYCCATNNPNQAPICMSTTISVQYKPEIDVVQFSNTVSSYNGGTIRLYCLARGVPSPLFTWYVPRNLSIAAGSHNVTGGSLLKLVTINQGSYGLYRCKAENIIGYDEQLINVTQIVLPTSKGTSLKSQSYVISPTSAVNQAHTSKRQDIISTNVVFSTPKVKQATTSNPIREDGINKKNILAAGGTVIFVLITTITILIVMIFKKYSKNKADVKKQQEENEAPSFPVESEEMDMPIYAKVDLSKKKKSRQQEDIPIYAQIDKSKKKRPDHIIYAELDDMHSTEVIHSAISPPLTDRDAYGEIDFTQNTGHADNVEPIYEAIPLE